MVAHDDLVVIRHAGSEVIRHAAVGPGEVALGPLADADRRPTRRVRPRTAAEVAFLGFGPAAETFLRSADAAGTLRLEHELRDIAELEAVWVAPRSCVHWSVGRVSVASKPPTYAPSCSRAAVCRRRSGPVSS